MKRKKSKRGVQASPRFVRHFTCEVCGNGYVQRGPGRSRRVCVRVACQRKARQRRMAAGPKL